MTVYVGYGVTAIIGMAAKPGASPLDFTRLHLDPVTGRETGRLYQGALPMAPHEIMTFVYILHNELAMGSFGERILGHFALASTIDCFVDFCLTLPLSVRNTGKNYLSREKLAWLWIAPPACDSRRCCLSTPG
ncbi:MAG: hypothetical protein AB7U61_08780 [Methylocystis sp.]